jgi:glycine/D-amino acid oxidase-like deaminating enzyme
MTGPTAIVVGAGVFGASLAHRLATQGWQVTIVDQAPPGHDKATSSGETRVLRYGHGDEPWYTRLAWRARDLWHDLEAEAGTTLLVECGVLWLAGERDTWVGAGERTMTELGIPAERIGLADAAGMFPSFAPDGLAFALLEPAGGVLYARKANRVLVDRSLALGASWVDGRAVPDGAGVRVNGATLRADRVVWACGPWLPKLFPGLVELRVVRREYRYLDGGPGWDRVPVWIDFDDAFYGLPDLGSGVKTAPDDPGPPYDPDTGSRTLDPEEEPVLRRRLATRFPALAEAPLLGGRVCQYELTADTEFIIAPHPEHDGVWLLGGGSGHGFKHGPALGEYVATVVDGTAAPDPRFGLAPRAVRHGLRTNAADFAG